MKTNRRWYREYPRYHTENQFFISESWDWHSVVLAGLTAWLAALTVLVALALR